MATLYASNATNTRQTVPVVKSGAGEQDGKLRVAYDEYTFSSQVSSGNIIEFMKLPKGARIIGFMANCAQLTGAAGIFKLGLAAGDDGTAADDDAFFGAASFDIGAAALTVDAGDVADTAILGMKLSSDTIVQFECTETTGAAPVEVLQLAVMYILD